MPHRRLKARHKMTSEAIVTRFAPSPTGLLHVGHAYSAWVGWQAARERNGRFLLRIEDIDTGRCRPEYEAAIFEDLAWLGLDWPVPVRRQSEHQPDYRAALDALDALGVLYPCFCTRKEIQREIAKMAEAPHGPDGPLYPGTCRHLPSAERRSRIADGAPYALRIDVAKASRLAGPLSWHDETAGRQVARAESLGDAVLARKDSANSYHLCVTVDDHLQGVSLVTRGVDLFHATHLHRLLQALLDYDSPAYMHHPLIADDAGKRLAKRTDAQAIRAYREAGLAAAEVWSLAGVHHDPRETA